MPPSPSPVPTIDVLIVGAGISGIAAAHYISRALPRGATWAAVEKGPGVGGTWLWNTYPGACCDVASHFYSLSFAPNPYWSHRYSPQAEIRAYLERTAAAVGLVAPRLRTHTSVVRAVWNEDAGLYVVTLRDERTRQTETLNARFLMAGPGALSTPSTPALPGAASFAGKSFHSAAWDHSVSLAGKRVGIIGTGCSTAQILPAIIRDASHVTVFQRTPMWITPRQDYAYSLSAQRMFAYVPLAMWVYRLLMALWHEFRYFVFVRPITDRLKKIATSVANHHRKKGVKDLALREALTPSYPLGCKRVVISDDFYAAITAPNATLATGPILRLERGGLVTGPPRPTSAAASAPPPESPSDGGAQGGAGASASSSAKGGATGEETLHKLDVLVYATGFDIVASIDSLGVLGRGGLSFDKAFASKGGPEAYLGVMAPGFPNLSMLMGPNTGLGHSSMIAMIEAQASYGADLIATAIKRRYKTVCVREDVCDAYNKMLQLELRKNVWGGCTSWYNLQGVKNIVLWPFTVTRYYYELWGVVWRNYEVVRA